MSEVLALGFWPLSFCAIAAFLGAILQRLAGQGFGMVSAPMLAMVAPEFLPSTLLLLGAMIGFTSAAVDFSAVNKRELPAGFAGRALGAFLAAWIAISVANPTQFAGLVALTVYLGIALSLVGLRVPINTLSLFSAGTVAGVMGTLTAVGAPPMALLYQHEEQRRSAAMQNTFFFFGMVISIIALAATGLVVWRHFVFAAFLAPIVLVALWLSHPLSRKFAKSNIRPWALLLAGIAATVLLIKIFV